MSKTIEVADANAESKIDVIVDTKDAKIELKKETPGNIESDNDKCAQKTIDGVDTGPK